MKPPEILELEKEFDIKVWETQNLENIIEWQKQGAYIINKFNRVTSINLNGVGLDKIPPLQSFVDVEFINLSNNTEGSGDFN